MTAGQNPRTPRTARELLSFLVVGGSNTVLSSLLYLVLLTWLSHTLAYLLAYVAGTIYSGIVNARYTFRASLKPWRLLGLVLYYLGLYLLNAAVLEGLVTILGIDERMAIVFVILLGVPLGFLGSRYILRT